MLLQNYFLLYLIQKSDYIISQTENILVLCDSARENIQKGIKPYILITFYSDTDCMTLLSDTGSWSDSQSFAGKLQEYFNSKNSVQYDLSAYSQLSEECRRYTEIDGVIVEYDLSGGHHRSE